MLTYMGRPIAESEKARRDYEESATYPSFLPDGFRWIQAGEMTQPEDIYFSTGKWYRLGENCVPVSYNSGDHGPMARLS